VVAAGVESVCAPDSVAVPAGADWYGAGDGWSSYADLLQARLSGATVGTMAGARPHAADVAALAIPLLQAGGGLPAEQAAPVYLRNKVADKPGAKV